MIYNILTLNFKNQNENFKIKRISLIKKYPLYQWKRQLPILPGRVQPSTLGVIELNFCVRNENRWNLNAIVTAMVI